MRHLQLLRLKRRRGVLTLSQRAQRLANSGAERLQSVEVLERIEQRIMVLWPLFSDKQRVGGPGPPKGPKQTVQQWYRISIDVCFNVCFNDFWPHSNSIVLWNDSLLSGRINQYKSLMEGHHLVESEEESNPPTNEH